MNRILALSLLVVMLGSSVGRALAAPPADITYTVQRGDTLFGLALRFGVTVQAIMQANGLTSSLIFVGQQLIIPTTSGGGTSAGTAGSGSVGPCGKTYTVQRGDTLRVIAGKCRTTVTAIAALNSLTNVNLIFVGQVLKMPTVPGGTSGSTGTSGNAPIPTVSAPAITPAPGQCPAIYTVQRGDTLKIIADKCGVTAQAIIANNTLPNPNLIFVGQQISIPGGMGSGSVPPAAAPTQPASGPTPAGSPVTTTHGVTGQFTLCNPEKPSFAANIERICFREIVFNTTGQPVSYSLLGVQATNLGGGPNQFQTSWRGDLVIPAGGQGPTAGGWEDGIYIEAPGAYRLQLAICFLNVDSCQLGLGWEILTPGVDVKVVFWLP